MPKKSACGISRRISTEKRVLGGTIDFFRELGLELEGRATIEAEWAGRVTGLGDQRVEIAMMRTPDSHGERSGLPPRHVRRG
jgi:hypothetical protein